MKIEIEYGYTFEDAAGTKLPICFLNRELVRRLTGRVLTIEGAKALLEEFK